jgi:hypothetical protein
MDRAIRVRTGKYSGLLTRRLHSLQHVEITCNYLVMAMNIDLTISISFAMKSSILR